MTVDEGRRQRRARRTASACPAARRALAVSLAALAGVAVMTAASATESRGDDGAALYRTHCAPCHGVEGRGDGPVAPALSPPPSDLTKSTLTTAELMKVIDGRRTVRAHGDMAMPVWGKVFEQALEGSPRQHRDALRTVEILAEYVRKLEGSAGSPPAR
jgi:mono/diheme cytochrome c family protein